MVNHVLILFPFLGKSRSNFLVKFSELILKNLQKLFVFIFI